MRLSGRRSTAAAATLALLLGIVVAGTPREALGATPDAVSIAAVCDGVAGAGFTDIRGTTFEDEIACFADHGFTRGTRGGTTYEPFGSSTRWQMATFIHRVLKTVVADDPDLGLPSSSNQGFTDIGALDTELRDAINVLAELDVVKGSSATTFDPYSPIRRDQMASFINRAQGALQKQVHGDPAGYTTSNDFFPDVGGSSVHEDNVEGIASKGIVQGRTDGTYQPGDPVKRGQMAAYVMRWFAVLDAEGVPDDPPSDDPTGDPTDPSDDPTDPSDDPTGDPTADPTDEPTDGGDLPVIDDAVVDTGLLDSTIGTGDVVRLQFSEPMDDATVAAAAAVMTVMDDDGTTAEIDCSIGCVLDDIGGLGLLGDNSQLTIVITTNIVQTAPGTVSGLAVGAEIVDLTDAYQDTDGDPVDLGNSGDVVLDGLDLGLGL